MADQKLLRRKELERDKAWLQEGGILPYDKLKGVEISSEKYKKLLDMESQKGREGLEALFVASKESQTIDPTGSDLSAAECEVYVRLKLLFPEKSDSWRKAETILYFGRTIQ